jgi:hypothetical protein
MNRRPAHGQWLAWAVLLAPLLAGCAGLRPAELPMPAVWYPAHEGAVASSLLVLLPGARDAVESFDRQGVIAEFRSSHPDWDVVAVDAHLGYYRQQLFVERLQLDIIEPARARGYQHIWLSGPSLGGFGSLLYLCLGDIDRVAGVIAIAPHLGGRAILADIEAAGGPRHWRPGAAGQDFERDLWQCLVEGPTRPVWLAWGEDDRMDRGNRLLAELLPADRVLTGPGGHRWSVWVEFWADIFPIIEDPES